MKKIKLEPENLKINSDGWKKYTNENSQEYLVNPEDDVWEYKGDQYFTWDAAMREVEKLGKRLPTDEEMRNLKKEDYGKTESVGDRDTTDGAFDNLRADNSFWSSTEFGNSAWRRYLYSSNTTVYRDAVDKTYGFSVRCVQE